MTYHSEVLEGKSAIDTADKVERFLKDNEILIVGNFLKIQYLQENDHFLAFITYIDP